PRKLELPMVLQAGKTFKYQTAREALLRMITERRMPMRAVLPSEQELARLLKVSRNTLRNALAVLCKEGVLEKRNGHPAVVLQGAPLPFQRRMAWLTIGSGTLFENVFYLEMFQRTVAEAASRGIGMDILPVNSPEMLEALRKTFDSYLGVIINAAQSSELNETALRMLSGKAVILDHFPHTTPCCLVQTDNYLGTRMLLAHLLDTGHRRIVLMHVGGYDQGYRPMAERRRAYRDSMAEHNLEEQVLESRYAQDYYDLIAFVRRNIPVLRKCDAIFADGDLLAIMLATILPVLGVRIPEDLSLAGFDGVQFACHLRPALTTVRQPQERLAAALIDTLLDLEAGAIQPGTETLLEPELLLGETSRNHLNQERQNA
ncbi:MAG: GntR family transcriptional regulator, partial [Victivallales bacterium]|nr:GntR family transcriptional regulator [Victivallales bacterium]